MPSEKLRTWFHGINRNARISFYAAIIAGFITHLFIMTNKVFNYNEIAVLFLDKQDMTMGRMAEGRWFVGFIGQLIGDNYSMQMVTGVIGILLLACISGMIVGLLEISKPLYAVLIAAGLVTFSAISSFFAFTQLGDAWFFALFLAVFAVFLSENKKWGIWPGLICIGLSLAIHQAYVSVAIAFMFILLFQKIFEKNSSLKPLLPNIGRYLFILIGGFAFYYVGVKITAAVYQYNLSDYHGISDMTEFTIRGICKGFVYSYLYFVRYFFTTQYLYSYFFVVLNVLLMICLLSYVIRSIILSFRKREIMNGILKIFMVLVLPVGMNGLPVLLADRVGAGVDRYMMYSLVFLWVLMIYLADRAEAKEYEVVKGRKIFLWVITIGIMLNIGHDYVIDNQAYYREQAVTNQVDDFLNRVVARIETTEGYEAGMPVYFDGCSSLFEQYPLELPSFDMLAEMRGTAYEPNYSSDGIVRYLNYYLHFPVTSANQELVNGLIQTQEYEQMECYPAANAARVINGVMVVKISDTLE